ncbi:hypothetical protein [Anaerobacterium chartisolvens]|nr:hypothetical protein [Anaerobacterium chartisolvens]
MNIDPTVKELKIKVQKDVTTYLNYSLPLCGILSENKLYAWFYEHFIQIYALTDNNGNLWIDYLEDKDFYKNVAEYEIYGCDELKDVGNIIELVADKINMQYYIIVYIDEYYLPGKESYRQWHFLHSLMIYGYDNEKEILKTIAFNNNKDFTQTEYTYGQFVEAYEEGKLYYDSSPVWVTNETLEVIRLKEIDSYKFDIKSFLEELNGYLSNQGEYSKIRPNNLKINGEKATFNYMIYDELLYHLNNLIQGKITMDYRYMHLMFEHKEIMYKRLKYIGSMYKASDELNELINEYSVKVRNSFKLARNLFFKQMIINRSTDNKSYANEILLSIIHIVKQIKANEHEILADVYTSLRSIF